MLACFADANTPDRREAVVADRDIPRKPCCGGISAPVAPISTRDSGTECSLYGLYQRKRDVACGELRGERGANRERRKLPVLRRGRDAGGRTSHVYTGRSMPSGWLSRQRWVPPSPPCRIG